MPNREGRIALAIQAIKSGQVSSLRAAAESFDVPYTTLYHRYKGRLAKSADCLGGGTFGEVQYIRQRYFRLSGLGTIPHQNASIVTVHEHFFTPFTTVASLSTYCLCHLLTLLPLSSITRTVILLPLSSLKLTPISYLRAIAVVIYQLHYHLTAFTIYQLHSRLATSSDIRFTVTPQ